MTRESLIFDTVVREYIYGLRSDGITYVLTMITYLGNWQTIALISFLFLLFTSSRKSFGVPLAATAVISSIIQKTLKITFQRERPDVALHLIQQGGYSFPSGHSMTILVFYGMVIFLCRQNIKNRTIANTVTVLLSILIFFIGFSRIYLGVHYPTDVLGGWSLGICLLSIIVSFNPFGKNLHSPI